MVKIKILGSGNGISAKKRFHASVAVSAGRDVYLFDAGEPVSSLLLRAGIGLGSVKAVFISHVHADHFSGIFQLVQSMQLCGRKNKLILFVPGEAIGILKKFLELLLLEENFLPYSLEILPVKPGEILFKDKNLRVFAYANSHLKNYKRESYSYLIEGKKKIVYSGDVGSIKDLTWIPKLDALILELAHIKLEDVVPFLKTKEIKKIILSHLHPHLDGKEKSLLNNKIFPLFLKKKTLIAFDGMEVKT